LLYSGLCMPLGSCDIKNFSGRVMPGSTKIIAEWLTSRGCVSTVPTWLPRSGGDGFPAAVTHGAVTGSRILVTKSADDLPCFMSDENNGHVPVALSQPLLQLEPAEARQAHIEQQAAGHLRARAAQELLRRCEGLDP